MAASCLSRVMSAMTMKPRFVTDNAKGMLASPVLTVLGSLIVKGNFVISYRRELLCPSIYVVQSSLLPHWDDRRLTCRQQSGTVSLPVIRIGLITNRMVLNKGRQWICEENKYINFFVT